MLRWMLILGFLEFTSIEITNENTNDDNDNLPFYVRAIFDPSSPCPPGQFWMDGKNKCESCAKYCDWRHCRHDEQEKCNVGFCHACGKGNVSVYILVRRSIEMEYNLTQLTRMFLDYTRTTDIKLGELEVTVSKTLPDSVEKSIQTEAVRLEEEINKVDHKLETNEWGYIIAIISSIGLPVAWGVIRYCIYPCCRKHKKYRKLAQQEMKTLKSFWDEDMSTEDKISQLQNKVDELTSELKKYRENSETHGRVLEELQQKITNVETWKNKFGSTTDMRPFDQSLLSSSASEVSRTSSTM